jgi:hypothetical protein
MTLTQSKRVENANFVPLFISCTQTTFLNYVLTVRHGKRIAVIQNEFGQGTEPIYCWRLFLTLAEYEETTLFDCYMLIELGLERAMLIGKDGDRVSEWLELPNGPFSRLYDAYSLRPNVSNGKSNFLSILLHRMHLLHNQVRKNSI